MKKLFLTSGLIISMACPAFAATDIDPNGNGAGGNTAANCTYTYLDSYTGPVNYEAKWAAICYAGGVNLDSNEYSSASGNAKLYDATQTATPTPIYIRYDDGMYTASGCATNTHVTNDTLTRLPTLTGYEFQGFYDTKAHASQDSNPEVSTQMIDSTGALTAYGKTNSSLSNTAGTPSTWFARWTPQAIKFAYTCGTAPTNSVYTQIAVQGTAPDQANLYYDAQYTLESTAPNCSLTGTGSAGYHWGGWSCSVDPEDNNGVATYKSTESNSVWSVSKTISKLKATSTVTCDSIWTGNPYTITYHAGYGQNGSAEPRAATGSDSVQNVVFGDGHTVLANTTTNYSLTGYDFGGWRADKVMATGADAAALANDYTSGGQEYSAGATVNPYSVIGNTNMYAIWNPICTAVTLDSKKYSSGEDATGVAATSNATPASVSVQYDGSFMTSGCASAQSLTCPTLTGYTFKGFFDSKAHAVAAADGTTTTGQTIDASCNITDAGNTITSAATWFAAWKADAQDITWSCGTGTGDVTGAPASWTYDGQYNLPSTATGCTAPNGYHFGGWTCSYNPGTGANATGNSTAFDKDSNDLTCGNTNATINNCTISKSGTFKGTSALTCTAIWSPNTVIPITFNLNRSANDTGTISGENTGSCIYDGTLYLPEAPTGDQIKQGYHFDGWRVRASNNQNQGS